MSVAAAASAKEGVADRPAHLQLNYEIPVQKLAQFRLPPAGARPTLRPLEDFLGTKKPFEDFLGTKKPLEDFLGTNKPIEDFLTDKAAAEKAAAEKAAAEKAAAEKAAAEKAAADKAAADKAAPETAAAETAAARPWSQLRLPELGLGALGVSLLVGVGLWLLRRPSQKASAPVQVSLNKQLSAAEMENFAALPRDRPAVRDVADTVECSVFAPPAVPPAETALIQVFLHLPEQAERASFLATAMDSSTTSKGARYLEIEIKRGARVELSLAGSGLLIDEPVQSVVWQGQPAFCQFLVTVPTGTSGHSFFPVVRVSIDGVLVGCIKFRILSDSSATNPQSRPSGDHACRYQKAFVSYATKDRKEVLKRVQMLNVMKTEFFLDALSLDPGDRWERKLYENINRCDLFLLFWSQAAKDSQWVIREAEYALNQQQKSSEREPDIVPVTLEQDVHPPSSLTALHFNDRIAYLISLLS